MMSWKTFWKTRTRAKDNVAARSAGRKRSSKPNSKDLITEKQSPIEAVFCQSVAWGGSAASEIVRKIVQLEKSSVLGITDLSTEMRRLLVRIL